MNGTNEVSVDNCNNRHVICCPRPSYRNVGKVTVWDLNQKGVKTEYPKESELPVKTQYFCDNCGHTKYI